MSNELTTREAVSAMTPAEIASVSDTPAKLLALAIVNGTPPETLEKLLALSERWEANCARKEYVSAMSDFKKAAPPAIIKQSKVDFTSGKGRTHYNYANLGDVVQQITPLLAKHGLHAAWETATPKDGPITVTCHVTHEAGHRESVTLSGPADTSGNKNAIQAVGSCVTYLQRYTLLAALGLATMEDDDDGRGGKDKQDAATPDKSEFQIAIEAAWGNIGKLKWLLEAGTKNGEPDDDLTAIRDRIAVLAPAPHTQQPPPKADPAAAAKVQELAREAAKLSPTGQHGTVQPNAPAGAPPVQPVKADWNGTPDEKTAYAMNAIPTADGEKLAKMAKVITPAVVGDANYRKIMEAMSARERELYPPKQEEQPEADPFDGLPPILQYLSDRIAEQSTVAGLEELAARWHADSSTMEQADYDAGVIMIQRAKVRV